MFSQSHWENQLSAWGAAAASADGDILVTVTVGSLLGPKDDCGPSLLQGIPRETVAPRPRSPTSRQPRGQETEGGPSAVTNVAPVVSIEEEVAAGQAVPPARVSPCPSQGPASEGCSPPVSWVRKQLTGW